MEMRLVYCSGCDQEVELLLRDGSESGGPHPDLSGAVCMGVGRHCTGTTCPIAAVPPREMRKRVERIRGWGGE
jgi:hypothetical protein